ncbi:MAG: DUF433 domain-containing protein [Gemmatales bacterium]
MNLPEFLTTDEFGAIRLAGTRIALSQLMWYYQEGQSVEALQQQFPTLGFAQIHKVLAYYWDNKAEIDAYLKQAEASMEENQSKSAKSIWKYCGNG